MKAVARRAPGGWIVIIPLTGAIAAYLFFIFFPGMREIRELGEQIVTKQLFLSAGAARTARLQAAEAEEAATREYLKQWRGTAVKMSEVSRLFGDVAECMKSSGVATTVFRPEPKQAFTAYERVPLTIGCLGTFTEMQSLLASIESLPQRIWIEEATFEREQDGEKMRCELKPAIVVNNFDISD